MLVNISSVPGSWQVASSSLSLSFEKIHPHHCFKLYKCKPSKFSQDHPIIKHHRILLFQCLELGSQNFSILHTSHPPFQWNIVLLTIKKNQQRHPQHNWGGVTKSKFRRMYHRTCLAFLKGPGRFWPFCIAMLVYQKEKNLPTIICHFRQCHCWWPSYVKDVSAVCYFESKTIKKTLPSNLPNTTNSPRKTPQIDGFFSFFSRFSSAQ